MRNKKSDFLPYQKSDFSLCFLLCLPFPKEQIFENIGQNHQGIDYFFSISFGVREEPIKSFAFQGSKEFWSSFLNSSDKIKQSTCGKNQEFIILNFLKISAHSEFLEWDRSSGAGNEENIDRILVFL